MSDLQAGTIWGSCRIEGVLGRGPNAVWYRAQRVADSHPVALKIFDESLDEGLLHRFEDDTRRIVGLAHPNVLRVESVGRENGRLTLVAERFEGRSLRTCVPRSPREGAELLLKASRGLGAAWMRLILHRNLKPENVLIASSGDLKLADFGLYRDPTPCWSPERVKGQTPDLRGELYSLGAIFKEIVPTGDPDLDALLHHMTRVETYERVQMVEDVISRLEAWLSRNPAPAPVSPLLPEPEPPPIPGPAPIPPPAPFPEPAPTLSTAEFPDPALDSARGELLRTLAAIPEQISRTLSAPPPPKPPPAPVFVPPPPPPPPRKERIPDPPRRAPEPFKVEVYIPPQAPPKSNPRRRNPLRGLLKTLVIFGILLGAVIYQNRNRLEKLRQTERLAEMKQQDKAQARRVLEERIRSEKASATEKDLLAKLQRKDWDEVRTKVQALDGERKYAEALEECERYLKKAGAKPPQDAVDLRKSLKDWVNITTRAESFRKNGSDALAYSTLAKAEATRPKEIQLIRARWCEEDWQKTRAATNAATAENDPDTALIEIDRFLKKPHQGGSHRKEAETDRTLLQAEIDYAELKDRVQNLRARHPADAVAALEAFLAKPHEGGAHRDQVRDQISQLRNEAQAILYSGRSAISRMAISPDGKRIAFTADGVRILDLATREEIWTAPVKSLQKALWLGGDDRLVTAGSVRVTLWNVAKKTEVRSVAPTLGYFSALAASADAKVVVAAQSDGSLWIWSPDGEEAPRVSKDIAAGAMTLALSPDGSTLAIAGRDRTLRIRDLPSGKERQCGEAPSTVLSMALSADGKRLLTGCANGLVSLWDAEAVGAVRDLTGHRGSVTWVTIAADGKTVASGGQDSLVRVTGLQEGARVRELGGHRGRISAVFLLPDRGLVSSASDGSVRIWPKP